MAIAKSVAVSCSALSQVALLPQLTTARPCTIVTQPELHRLSSILKAVNNSFGTLFTSSDRLVKKIREEVTPRVQADAGYQNAKQNTLHTARMAQDQAPGKEMQILLKDDPQIYKQFVENDSFKRFVKDMVYDLTIQLQPQWQPGAQ